MPEVIEELKAIERCARSRGTPACDAIAARLAAVLAKLVNRKDADGGMTRPTGEDAMSEKVTSTSLSESSVQAFTEALKGERGSLDAWLECNDEAEVRAHVEAYASRHAAPQPPAEAQPVAHYCEHRHKCKWHADGAWPSFGTGEGREQAWKDAHAERCGGRILPLYAHPPPSATVGVEGAVADLETIWHSVSDDKETNAAYQRLKSALSQQPAAVNDLNAWRAAFIAERAARYREGGMVIEQARIHAETDAACIDADALAAQKPAAVDEAMVERAWEAAMEIKHNKEPWFPMTKRRMKRALTAALATQRGDSHD